MGNFKTRFAAYGGDYETTLERFMGDEEFYLQMLGMLADDTSLERLKSALSENNLSAAFDAAHDLKGVSGNLGLTPLYDAMCAIVEPLRAGEARDYGTMLQTVQEEFQTACALLDAED